MTINLPYNVDENSTTISSLNLVDYPYLVGNKQESQTMKRQDIIIRLEAALYDKDWAAIELLLDDLEMDNENLDQGYDQFVDSDDDWDTAPVIAKKVTVEEEEDLAVAEMAAEEAQKAQYQTKEPTEAEKRKEEVYQIIINPTPEYYKFIFILLYSLIGNVGE